MSGWIRVAPRWGLKHSLSVVVVLPGLAFAWVGTEGAIQQAPGDPLPGILGLWTFMACWFLVLTRVLLTGLYVSARGLRIRSVLTRTLPWSEVVSIDVYPARRRVLVPHRYAIWITLASGDSIETSIQRLPRGISDWTRRDMSVLSVEHFDHAVVELRTHLRAAKQGGEQGGAAGAVASTDPDGPRIGL